MWISTGLGSSLNGLHTIKGEVWRVEPSAYFVKPYDGDQVRVHVDETTRVVGHIDQGEHIEARLNGENHALSIRSIE